MSFFTGASRSRSGHHASFVMSALRIVCLVLVFSMGFATEWFVGPGRTYTEPSQVSTLVSDGDTVSIDAGTYTGDECTWTNNNLTLRGVGGFAHLDMTGYTIANGKGIWVVDGNNTTIQSIELSGAAIPGTYVSGVYQNGSANAAGIRAEGSGLTVTNCYIHDNQDGILGGSGATSDIVIEGSEFAYNGYGDGYTHALYIGTARSLTFIGNYSHHTKVGHNLKTRALANYIIANRIMDEDTGTSSMAVDIPQGGLSFLLGNLIQQGPLSSNRSLIVSYAEEGVGNPTILNPSQHFYVINNTIVNDYTGAGGTDMLNIAASTTYAQVENNIFLGQGTPINGPTSSRLHNLLQPVVSPLVDRANFDYHLAATAADAIDQAVDPGTAEGQALLPTIEYVDPTSWETRTTSGTAPDIGAYEYQAPNTPPVINSASANPGTVTATTTALSATATDDGGEPNLIYTWNATGPATVTFSANGTNAAKNAMATFISAGAYSFTVTALDAGGLSGTSTFTVNVAATPTTVDTSPATAMVVVGAQAMFSASVSDQFGILLTTQPTVTWAVGGGGTINSSGMFTAGSSAGGPWTISASAGALSGTSLVTVTSASGTTTGGTTSGTTTGGTTSGTTTGGTTSGTTTGGTTSGTTTGGTTSGTTTGGTTSGTTTGGTTSGTTTGGTTSGTTSGTTTGGTTSGTTTGGTTSGTTTGGTTSGTTTGGTTSGTTTGGTTSGTTTGGTTSGTTTGGTTSGTTTGGTTTGGTSGGTSSGTTTGGTASGTSGTTSGGTVTSGTTTGGSSGAGSTSGTATTAGPGPGNTSAGAASGNSGGKCGIGGALGVLLAVALSLRRNRRRP
jgi:hypothetical protein